jgi:hypothetical protein
VKVRAKAIIVAFASKNALSISNIKNQPQAMPL